MLSVRGVGQEPAESALRTFLRGKDVLFVLDNFEQVLPAAPIVASLLGACPQLTVLVTSRERLYLDGERVVPLAPLPVPAADEMPKSAATAAAVRLFVDRARSIDPSFRLSEDATPVVGEICRLLDGLPLAIELAAPRVRHMPLATLRDRLQQRLALLTGGSMDRPSRQKTMRDAIAWSYDLLNPDVQAHFRRLSVFVGGFTLEAAERVTEGAEGAAERREDGKTGRRKEHASAERRAPNVDSAPLVLDGLAALIEASLLRHETGPDGPARYRMLETIHEFAGEQLAAAGEGDSARRAHAAYYLSLAERYEFATLLPENELVMDLLEAEHADLRVALSWLDATGDFDQFFRLVTGLSRFWSGQGYYQEGQTWLERALANSGAATAPGRGKALVRLGMIELFLGALPEAEGHLTAGLAACRAEGHAVDSTSALNGLGALASLRGDRARSIALHEEGLATALTVPDRRMAGIIAAWVLGNLAVVDRANGDLERAADRLEDALRRIREVGGHAAEIMTVGDLGDLARDRGDQAHAFGLYREALLLVRRYPGTRDVTDVIEAVGIASAAIGQAKRAARLLGFAEAQRERIGLRLRIVENQVAFEQAVAATRATLAEPGFAMAWNAGRKLRPAEAVAEAIATSETHAASPVTVLTPREMEILRLLAAGQANPAIAQALFISTRTVENHVAHVLAKLGVTTRADAVETAVAAGLVQPAPKPSA